MGGTRKWREICAYVRVRAGSYTVYGFAHGFILTAGGRALKNIQDITLASKYWHLNNTHKKKRSFTAPVFSRKGFCSKISHYAPSFNELAGWLTARCHWTSWHALGGNTDLQLTCKRIIYNNKKVPLGITSELNINLCLSLFSNYYFSRT